ncbi:MAG: protein nirF [Magnetococcales bacterium]|nr:protein nirF [Magnetococcales bacterium]
MICLALGLMASAPLHGEGETPLRGTGDLGLVVERASGRIQVVETTGRSVLYRIAGLGDLSHAAAVFSRDGRYAFLFARDGGLSKVDLLTGQLVKRVVQAGNSIGGAISQDGRLVAVANYQPGGVRLFSAADLAPLAEIPAVDANGVRSKVVGLEDATGQKFVFSLFDAGEIWVADVGDPTRPVLTKHANIGLQPYDALITPDGRSYIAGLFGEDGLALLDLWHPEAGVRRILAGYGRGEEQRPVYKMPHLEGWAMANGVAFLPAVGRHEVLVVNSGDWREQGRIAVHGQPVFVMARPDGRQVWVNFALPDNDTIQVIDAESLKVVQTLRIGKGVMHMEFTPRGEEVWVSIRDENRVDVFRTDDFSRVTSLPMESPSGIFFTNRAHRIGL